MYINKLQICEHKKLVRMSSFKEVSSPSTDENMLLTGDSPTF